MIGSRTASLLVFAAAAVAPATAAEKLSPVIWTLAAGTVSGAAAEPLVLGAPAVLDGGGASFDGEDDAYVLDENPLAGAQAFTIEMLWRPDAGGPVEQRVLHIQEGEQHRLLIELRMVDADHWVLDTFLRDGPEQRLTLIARDRVHPAATWSWVALRYDGTTMSHFVNGRCDGEGPVAFRPMQDGQTSLGVRLNRVNWFRGAIREVHFHRRALDVDELQRISGE